MKLLINGAREFGESASGSNISPIGYAYILVSTIDLGPQPRSNRPGVSNTLDRSPSHAKIVKLTDADGVDHEYIIEDLDGDDQDAADDGCEGKVTVDLDLGFKFQSRVDVTHKPVLLETDLRDTLKTCTVAGGGQYRLSAADIGSKVLLRSGETVTLGENGRPSSKRWPFLVGRTESVTPEGWNSSSAPFYTVCGKLEKDVVAVFLS